MSGINIPIYAIDFEGAKSCGIVEFGIAKIVNWEIVEVKSQLCAPKKRMNKEALEFCNLQNVNFSNKKPFDSYCQDFIDLRKEGIFLSHNKSAEDSLLRSYCPVLPDCKNFVTGKMCNTWAPWLDTLLLTKNIFPKIKGHNLEHLIEIFDLKEKLESLKHLCPANRDSWHCAPYDAIACALILIHISSLENFENLTLDWLSHFSGNKKLSQRTFF